MSTLAACTGSGSSGVSAGNATSNSHTAKINAPIIDNEDLTSGLMGIDANNNGIRDDIDRLIAQKYSATPGLKKAAEQTARALQHTMEATTRQQALAAGDENNRASDCVTKQLSGQGSKDEKIEIYLAISREIEALTANTRERMEKYLNSNTLMSGGYLPQVKEPVCD
jgi:hypothetical protein